MDEQEVVEQTAEEASASFMEGFNAVRSDEQSPEPKAVEPDPVAEQPEAPIEEVKAEDESKDEPEEATYFGMSESQIKSLLERSARVDSLQDQLQKAHGKIGEINRTLQQMSSQQPKPTQSAPVEVQVDEHVDQWSQEFPEVAAIARNMAERIVQEKLAGFAPGEAQPAINPADVEKQINLAVMDATHEGWRETVNSQDFTLWIATQPEDVQETYNNTISAKELGRILKGYDSWKTNIQDRSSKNKQRLEQAIVPTGNASKISHASTPQDDFLAGFNAIRNQYR